MNEIEEENLKNLHLVKKHLKELPVMPFYRQKLEKFIDEEIKFAETDLFLKLHRQAYEKR